MSDYQTLKDELTVNARDWATDCIETDRQELLPGKVTLACAKRYIEINYPGGWAGFEREHWEGTGGYAF